MDKMGVLSEGPAKSLLAICTTDGFGLEHAEGLGIEISSEIHPKLFLREGVLFLEGRSDLYNLWDFMQNFCPHRCQNINST